MSARRAAPPALHCPACGGEVADHHARCLHCGFTGQDSMAIFGDRFFAIDPIRDGAGCWSEKEIAAIRAQREKMRRTFPQVRFHVESVCLAADAPPSAYGFWRINTAPLGKRETKDHRTWAVLLVVDAQRACAAVACGYRIGHWMRDDAWQEALESMVKPWRKGRLGEAVCDFMRTAGRDIDRAWVRQVMRPD